MTNSRIKTIIAPTKNKAFFDLKGYGFVFHMLNVAEKNLKPKFKTMLLWET